MEVKRRHMLNSIQMPQSLCEKIDHFLFLTATDSNFGKRFFKHIPFLPVMLSGLTSQADYTS